MTIEILDTTLRDGEQGAGIRFTDDDRLKIIHALDKLGVSYVEAGNFTAASDTGDGGLLLCERARKSGLQSSSLVAFWSTRKPDMKACDDKVLKKIAESEYVDYVTIYGKSALYQVYNVLRTDAEENLEMIRDSVSFLTESGKNVFFDAEHFFDGYADNPTYAMKVLEVAYNAGAKRLILCDTNGGMLTDTVGVAVSAAVQKFPNIIGIHCHNDMGLAVACSVTAVLSGAVHVQGTISGIGERCGNANLNTLIPVLQLKLGYTCISDESLKNLTHTARYINEVSNKAFDEREPFVGGYAFTHKAGSHIDGVEKTSKSFEHIEPERVGNLRNIIISGLSGRAALREKMTALNLNLEKNSPEVMNAVALVKSYESRGYVYEDAEASLILVIKESLGMKKKFFELQTYKVLINEPSAEAGCTALIKISVDTGGTKQEEITAAEGKGPIHALDTALRQALLRFYPELTGIRLSDYKVRVINSSETTASVVRVIIESTDGTTLWRTIGVSQDIIQASWQALRDAYEYKLDKGEA